MLFLFADIFREWLQFLWVPVSAGQSGRNQGHTGCKQHQVSQSTGSCFTVHHKTHSFILFLPPPNVCYEVGSCFTVHHKTHSFILFLPPPNVCYEVGSCFTVHHKTHSFILFFPPPNVCYEVGSCFTVHHKTHSFILFFPPPNVCYEVGSKQGHSSTMTQHSAILSFSLFCLFWFGNGYLYFIFFLFSLFG